MIILTGILGLIVGLLAGIYIMHRKGKQLSSLYLDKLFINSLLKDAIKVGDTKKLKKD